jgi:hypothetical protein
VAAANSNLRVKPPAIQTPLSKAPRVRMALLAKNASQSGGAPTKNVLALHDFNDRFHGGGQMVAPTTLNWLYPQKFELAAATPVYNIRGVRL